MLLGHFSTALLVSTLDWKPEAVIFVTALHFLPNTDVIPIKIGLLDKKHHGGFSHSLFLALLVSGLIFLFSFYYARLAFLALIMHLLVDLPSSEGLELFWPIFKRRFSLNLWQDNGFLSLSELLSGYKQKWQVLTEIIVTTFLVLRLVTL